MEDSILNNAKSCPSCLTENNTSADFCSECGHPIGNFVNLDPVDQIQSQGHLFMEATNNPRSLIIIVGLWLYFGIAIIGVSLFLFFSNQDLPFMLNLFLIGIAILGGLILHKATKNYLNRKK